MRWMWNRESADQPSGVTVEGAPDRNASTVLDPHPISRPGSTGTTCTSTWSVPGPGSDIPATPSLIRQVAPLRDPVFGWPSCGVAAAERPHRQHDSMCQEKLPPVPHTSWQAHAVFDDRQHMMKRGVDHGGSNVQFTVHRPTTAGVCQHG